MIQIRLARWQAISAYVVLGVLSFVAGLYLTFPYETLRQRLIYEADQLSLQIRIRKMGLSFFGITALGVQVSRKVDPKEEPSSPIVFESVTVRPSLLPPGINLRAQVFGGTVTGAIGSYALTRLTERPSPTKRDAVGTLSIALRARNLALNDDSIKKAFGVDLSGTASSDIKLSTPMVPSVNGYDLDWAQASGRLSVDFKQLSVLGGTITFPVDGEPTPIDLPRISVGDLDGRIKVEKGLGSIEKLQTQSEDLELAVTGNLRLAKKIDYSIPDLQIKFKPNAEFTRRLGTLGMGIAQLPNDPADPSFRLIKVAGFLSRPQVTNIPGMR